MTDADGGTEQDRDPLGKRALFSEATPAEPESGPGGTEQPEERPALYVHCSSCDTRSPLSVAGFLVQHFPIWAWIPGKRDPHLMRCPACGRIAWHTIS